MALENFEIAKYFAEFAKNGLKVGNMDHLWCFSFSLKSSLQMNKNYFFSFISLHNTLVNQNLKKKTMILGISVAKLLFCFHWKWPISWFIFNQENNYLALNKAHKYLVVLACKYINRFIEKKFNFYYLKCPNS